MLKIVKTYLTSIKTKWNLEVEMFFGNLDAANANLPNQGLISQIPFPLEPSET